MVRRCRSCGRICFGRGAGALIEGARIVSEADGSDDWDTPALDFINSLMAENSDDNKRRLADLHVRLNRFSRQGEASIPDDVRELRGPIWEIKAGDVRLLFFHVDAPPADQCHQKTIRLTHGFIKQTVKTPQHEIVRAEWIRREDLSGDDV